MPLTQFLLGAYEGGDDFSSIPTLDWDRLRVVQQPVHRFLRITRLVDEKTDETLHAPTDQESIDKRHVIAHEQCGTTHGRVLLPDNTDSIQCVCEQPQAEADEHSR